MRRDGHQRRWAALALVVCALFAACLCAPATAAAEETEAELNLTETKEVPLESLEAPVLTEAEGAVVIDTAGNELFTLNPDARMEPASTTKVMTAMVILDSGLPLSDIVTIKRHDIGDGAQMADYEEGAQVSLGELMLVMLVYSGNDAAYNAACYVAGSESAFCDLMNAKAKELHMDHTHFVNSHGYEDPNHYSCARDLAIMGRHAMQNYPLIAQAVLLTEVTTTIRGYLATLPSTDRLLSTYPGARGVKTGAVTNSYTFVGAVGRGDHQLYSAVVGCKSWSGRFQDTSNMFDWCYAHLAYEQAGRSSRIIHTQPLSCDLGLSCVVADELDTVVRSWMMLDPPTTTQKLPTAATLTDAGVTYGWRDEVQEGDVRSGRIFEGTRGRPVRVSAFTDFTRPLFVDSETLGRF